jgi:hypothetical protein
MTADCACVVCGAPLFRGAGEHPLGFANRRRLRAGLVPHVPLATGSSAATAATYRLVNG